jgi:glycosyltransferase involved in cell wall biosynthesis
MRPEHDGVTRVLYRLLAYLNKHDIKSIFLSPIVPSDDRGTQFHKVPSITFPLYQDYRFALPGLRYFEQELRAFRPDILHINSPCSLGYAAVTYAQRNRIPVVATYHTHFASYAKYYNVTALEGLSWRYIRKLYNSCQRTFVPSEPILKELHEHGIRHLEFLPHGVDAEVFNPKLRDQEWKNKIGAQGKHVLLFAGRLVWEKDLKTLAEAYKLLTEKRSDVVFVLAGDGPVRDDLARQMPEAIFLGHQAQHDLAVAYASSEVFVFPSTTETFGNVTLEAMACGLPPICARAGGAYGIIRDGWNGLLAAPRCSRSLTEKIELLLDNPVLRETISNEAYAFAQQQQWENIFERMFASYDSVIHEYNQFQELKGKQGHGPSVYYRPSFGSAH